MSDDYDIKNLILSTLITFDSIRRDGIYPEQFSIVNNQLDDSSIQYVSYNDLFKYITTYKYNTRSDPKSKYYAYSFAFRPEILQPSGTMNMSTISRFGLTLIIDRLRLIKYIGNENLKKLGIRLNLFTFEYNILRYQSSMAHLLFLQ